MMETIRTYTTKLDVKFNYERIDEDFQIIEIVNSNGGWKWHDKKGKTGGADFIDAPLQELDATSTLWTSDGRIMVLYDRKKYKKTKLIDLLREKAPEAYLCPMTSCESAGVQTMLTLLINALPKLLTEREYNNITGKLFLEKGFQNTGPYFSYLQAEIKQGLILNLKQVTFKKCTKDKMNEGKFAVDKSEGVFLRRRLPNDKPTENLIICQKKGRVGKKFRTDFIDISNWEKFAHSKSGLMADLLEKFNQKYKKYLIQELHFVREDEVVRYKTKKSTEKADFSERVKKQFINTGKSINIIDKIRDDNSQKLIDEFNRCLKKDYGIETTVSSEVVPNQYNIIVIHDKNYYKDNTKLIDEHYKNGMSELTQHLTVEGFVNDKGKVKDMSAACKVILRQLVIKNDLLGKQITMTDWPKYYDITESITFVTRENLAESEENDRDDESKRYQYFRLTIQPNGKCLFDNFSETNVDPNGDEEKIIQCFERQKKQNDGYARECEGVFYSDIKNIHAIIRTPERVIPNLSILNDMLKKTKGENEMEKNDLLQYIDEYTEIQEKLKNDSKIKKAQQKKIIRNAEKFREEICKQDDRLNYGTIRKQFRKIGTMNEKFNKGFNDYVYQKSKNKILFAFCGKNKEAFKDNLFDSRLGINYKENNADEDFKNQPTLAYWSGENNPPQSSFPCGTVVRKIIAEKKNHGKKVLKLLEVDFVRNDQYTVLPFPYKYLREYKEMCKYGKMPLNTPTQ